MKANWHTLVPSSSSLSFYILLLRGTHCLKEEWTQAADNWMALADTVAKHFVGITQTRKVEKDFMNEFANPDEERRQRYNQAIIKAANEMSAKAMEHSQAATGPVAEAWEEAAHGWSEAASHIQGATCNGWTPEAATAIAAAAIATEQAVAAQSGGIAEAWLQVWAKASHRWESVAGMLEEYSDDESDEAKQNVSPSDDEEGPWTLALSAQTFPASILDAALIGVLIGSGISLTVWCRVDR
eukprot:gnl/MRDRNA2_/MRDRNA2_83890_c0_seq1.p1 gnl/MRDRNA2_/MRDRNA2_83890_c0~~gnl/MRDRNA2_/MRDRNA2_83890_c0_seq1.p1  ORF type:complete len:241 (+),score=62.33 gnl/MRDRNA2_/MRDRNA2_83890_c0_seq1:123-845(+)